MFAENEHSLHQYTSTNFDGHWRAGKTDKIAVGDNALDMWRMIANNDKIAEYKKVGWTVGLNSDPWSDGIDARDQLTLTLTDSSNTYKIDVIYYE